VDQVRTSTRHPGLSQNRKQQPEGKSWITGLSGKTMNPLGFLVIAIGILLVIIGIKGSQHNVIAAFTNKPAKTS
jgi:hypothetical protein